MSDYTELVKALRYCGNFTEREGCDESCEYFNDMDCPNRIMSDAAAAIEELQAEVERLEPKRGEWKETDMGWDGDTAWVCSVCGEPWTLIDGTPKENNMNYCPNCGAKMEVQDG